MKYFTIDELTNTSTGLPNQPDKAELDALTLLVDKILDPARELLGAPIKVNSGYRSKIVNEAVGGTDQSQHLNGQAVDITCEDNAALFSILENMSFDQLIWEKGTNKSPKWIHVSYVNDRENREQVLRFINGKYELY